MKLTILISSAGRRVGLLECFRESAAALGVELEILACDLDPARSAACAFADRAFPVPRCDHQAFVPALEIIVRENGVRLVIPTIDTELLPLAGSAGRLAAAGAHVHVSPVPVIDATRDKQRTAEVLAAAGVPVPWTVRYDGPEIARRHDLAWPLFMKPAGGSASRGIRRIDCAADLPQVVTEPMILQQLLDGPEYTVNLFVDRDGRLRSVVPHRRLSVRAGEVEKGRTVRDPRLRAIAEAVVRALPQARGVLCFQVIDDAVAGPKVFEINARFGGGYPLAHRAGATFTRWLVEEVTGMASTAHDDWRDGLVMLRYDAAVFRQEDGP